ncbi:MAG: hypothetical protein Q8T09_05380 [Candidatus Melainabacteria bacterium]|nr:hypothetical protein [Candidatus Melainabacteria bacterium]
MTEAVKPATDNTAKPAVETDASKKEKAAADGALDKMKTEVADATKPGKTDDAGKKPEDAANKPEDAAKKPEDAAKKPEEVAKKPEEAAKKPEEESLFNRIYDGVGNTVSALWNIRQPDKSADPKAIEALAKPKVESNGFLDLGAPIAGYDAKKTEAALELKTPEAVKANEPAKEGGGLWGWLGDKTTEAGKWIKDTFWAEKAEKADKILDSFSEVKLDSTTYQYKAVEKEDGLYEFLTKKNDGDVCKISDTACTRTFDKIQTTYDRQTRTSEIVDTETNRKFNRLADGSQVVSNPDGTKFGRRPDGSYFSVVNDQIAEVRGEADQKEISQRLDELERLYHRGQRVDINRPGELPFHRGRHNRVDTGENFDLTASPDGKVTFGRVDGKQVAILEDKSSYVFDPRTKQAIHVDATGKILERGTAEEMAKKVPGLVVSPDGRITMAGSSAVFKTDAATGQTTTEQTAASGKKIISVSADANGVEQTKFVGADGKLISQSEIDHDNPERLFVQKDAEGKVLTTYDLNTNTYQAADNSFKFSDDGTELFGGKVHVNNYGDISYSDGVRLSNSSPGAIQASEAAATSASANATSVASALSAKAGNPATVSAGDLSACYGAYGSIVAAMNACLTSGNFAGFGQCLAAKGALESAIGVIAPKLVAMDDAAKSGLSGYALNEVGQKTGGSTNYLAIEEIRNRQAGTSQTA